MPFTPGGQIDPFTQPRLAGEKVEQGCRAHIALQLRAAPTERAHVGERLLAAVVKRANSQYGMKTNDQEMVSDMYIERQFNISLDWHAMIFQCMHSTRDAPLPLCNPMEHLRESKGIWKNTLTGTMPALFHFK